MAKSSPAWVKEHRTKMGQENQGSKAEHIRCCSCHATGTLLVVAARNEIRIGACLSLHLNNFFPSSSPVGFFPLHLDQIVSRACWQWGARVPAPTGRMPKVSCRRCPLPHLGEGGAQAMGKSTPDGCWAVLLSPSTHITTLSHRARKGRLSGKASWC